MRITVALALPDRETVLILVDAASRVMDGMERRQVGWVGSTGLLPGHDWRLPIDNHPQAAMAARGSGGTAVLPGTTWHHYPADRTCSSQVLLSTMCLSVFMWAMLMQADRVLDTREHINRVLWTGQFYADTAEQPRFDLLGNALALLTGVATPERARLVVLYARTHALVPGVGFFVTDEAGEQVVWPWVNAAFLFACHITGHTELARELLATWQHTHRLSQGYTPAGQILGSRQFLATAASFLAIRRILAV